MPQSGDLLFAQLLVKRLVLMVDVGLGIDRGAVFIRQSAMGRKSTKVISLPVLSNVDEILGADDDSSPVCGGQSHVPGVDTELVLGGLRLLQAAHALRCLQLRCRTRLLILGQLILVTLILAAG